MAPHDARRAPRSPARLPLAAAGPSRRGLLQLTGLALAGAALPGCGSTSTPAEKKAETLTARQALKKLKEGNARFAAGKGGHPHQGVALRKELAEGQHPFAQVLSCVDSRVPPEIVFDQGLGDLFVTRTAGHVPDKAALGSLEFGVAELKTPLIIVLGHQKCGAVKATVEAAEKGYPKLGNDLDTLVAAIRPAVESAEEELSQAEEAGDSPAAEKDASTSDEEATDEEATDEEASSSTESATDELLDTAVRLNVEQAVARISAAPVLSTALEDGSLRISGAYYNLETGKVTFIA